MIQDIEQERVRLQNQIDDLGVAVSAASEAWCDYFTRLMVDIETHHKIDPQHRFVGTELKNAELGMRKLYDTPHWYNELERIQSQ